ncbi:hypothetical protein K9M59_02175 [Candidatus Gracilibacteria bacterium]|nr:hypothetical protein [Candidatus Gracilibacteria bacterium]MCF7819649.1 hypothetical protein [Candidatus Gracilibacteria bacterium]
MKKNPGLILFLGLVATIVVVFLVSKYTITETDIILQKAGYDSNLSREETYSVIKKLSQFFKENLYDLEDIVEARNTVVRKNPEYFSKKFDYLTEWRSYDFFDDTRDFVQTKGPFDIWNRDVLNPEEGPGIKLLDKSAYIFQSKEKIAEELKKLIHLFKKDESDKNKILAVRDIILQQNAQYFSDTTAKWFYIDVGKVDIRGPKISGVNITDF